MGWQCGCWGVAMVMGVARVGGGRRVACVARVMVAG